jgi:hypothetical protein
MFPVAPRVTQYGSHPSRRWIEDPGDPVWFWFVFNGPHGERFSWHRDASRGSNSLELLRDFIAEREASSPGFFDSARAVALKAIQLPDVVMIRTAIQVLCVVGTDDDMEIIQPLLEHTVQEIKVDAQCCLFERRVRRASDAG